MESSQPSAPASQNTRMCRSFLRGTCKRGSECHFSHGSVKTFTGGPAPSSSTSAGKAKAPPDATSTRSAAEKALQKKERRKELEKQKLSKNGEALIVFIESSADIKVSDATVRLEAFEFLASYNWAPSKKPTIYVPGYPARWNPPTLPIQLHQDQGQVFVNQNQKRSPAGSFMPFFEALLIMQPTFNMSAVDLITDRNGLRKLLDWTEGRVKNPWRIEVDIVGETMIFTRWEANPTNMLTGTSTGFGHEFEKRFTEQLEDLKKSTGHHRIVKYTIGGLQLLVRFEVDAYVSSSTEEGPGSDAMVSSLEKMSIQNSFTDTTPAGHVKVLRAGQLVDSTSLLEVKTRSKGSGIQLSQVMPQLYFSQTPHIYTAHHTKGYIAKKENISKATIDEEGFRKWEDQKQESLKKLVALISYVKELTEGKGGQFLLICEKGEGESGKGIQILERSGKGIGLPATAKVAYWPENSELEDGGVMLKEDA